MMKIKKILAIALLIMVELTLSLAVAETNEKSDTVVSTMERITVTASRSEMLDTDLAMSVSSISTETLAMDNGQHVSESLNSISGVLLDQLSGGQGHKTAIRMPINTSGYYLYLQDNVPLQSAAFFNHNALWWSSFNSNVERMEVLKGAGTALYGSGSVAATVNILSEPVAMQTQTTMDVLLGSEQYRKLQVSHSNKISTQQGIRASASYLTNDGWRDHTASERAEINVRHEYDISANERIVTSFMASDLEQEMVASLSAEQYHSDPSDSGLSAEMLAQDPLRTTQYMRLSSQWDKVSNDNYYSLISFLRYRTNDHTATWNTNMPIEQLTAKTIGLLALANYSHQSNSETTIGIDIEYTEGDQLSYQPIDITTTGWGADTYLKGEKFYDDTTVYSNISPYLQHQYRLNEQLEFTLGLRYDYAKYEFTNHLGVYGDIGHGKISLQDREDDFSHFSPKASVNYHLSENTSMYARYANSFRLPTASSLYHLTTQDSEVVAPVDPETSDTYELGYKGNFDTISVDAAIYFMDVDDGIVQAYNDDGQRYLTNATRVVHKGFEISTLWAISTEWNVSAAYSKSQHKFVKDEQYQGNEMRMAPNYIANVRLRYAPSFFDGFSSQLEFQSIGEYWMDDNNSTNPETGLARKYSGHSLLNIKAIYQVNSQLSLNARITNLTDKKYAMEAEYRYGRDAWHPGTPRTLFMGLNYQF